MKLRILAEADLEFAESVLYYMEKSHSTALRFIDAIERSYHEILSHPTRYRKEVEQVRIKVLEDFPFSIRYEIHAEEITILAVSHQARMPGYWQERT